MRSTLPLLPTSPNLRSVVFLFFGYKAPERSGGALTSEASYLTQSIKASTRVRPRVA